MEVEARRGNHTVAGHDFPRIPCLPQGQHQHREGGECDAEIENEDGTEVDPQDADFAITIL